MVAKIEGDYELVTEKVDRKKEVALKNCEPRKFCQAILKLLPVCCFLNVIKLSIDCRKSMICTKKVNNPVLIDFVQCPVPVKLTVARLPSEWLLAVMIPKGNMVTCSLK